MDTQGNEIAAIVAGLQEARECAEAIFEAYPSPVMTHVDYRVFAAREAETMLAALDQAIQRVQGLKLGNAVVDADSYIAVARNAEQRELFRILPDGTIQRGEAFTTTDEASLVFWEAVNNLRQPPATPISEDDAVDTLYQAARQEGYKVTPDVMLAAYRALTSAGFTIIRKDHP